MSYQEMQEVADSLKIVFKDRLTKAQLLLDIERCKEKK